MKDSLACLGIYIEYRAVSLLRDTKLLGELACHVKHMCQKCSVVRRDIVQARNVFPGADQDMNGGLRIDVVKRKHPIILVSSLRWQFMLPYSAKKTGLHNPPQNDFKIVLRVR